MSWISKKGLAELARVWIVLEIVIAVWVLREVGLPGLAKEYCDRFPMEKCEEIDWEYYGY